MNAQEQGKFSDHRSIAPQLNSLPAWLIRRAARTAPIALRPRLEEEWLADLATRTSALSRLSLALGCNWATLRIAYDHQSAIAAQGARANASGTVVLGGPAPGGISGRAVMLFLVAGAHLLVLAALVQTFRAPKALAPPPPLVTRVVNQPGPTRAEGPTTLWKRETPRVEKRPLAPPTTSFTFVTADPDDARVPDTGTGSGAGTVPPDVRVSGGPGIGFPSVEKYYPSGALVLSEQGAAAVQVCVDEKGRLNSAPRLASTSGSPRLDQGALNLAVAASGHYRPSTRNGLPISDCFQFRVRFQLNH